MALVLFAAAHLAAGILIGARLRVGALLIAFAVVLIEGIIGDRVNNIAEVVLTYNLFIVEDTVDERLD